MPPEWPSNNWWSLQDCATSMHIGEWLALLSYSGSFSFEEEVVVFFTLWKRCTDQDWFAWAVALWGNSQDREPMRNLEFAVEWSRSPRPDFPYFGNRVVGVCHYGRPYVFMLALCVWYMRYNFYVVILLNMHDQLWFELQFGSFWVKRVFWSFWPSVAFLN